MNFLAHLFFDHGCPEAMIGSLLPDLTHGRGRRDHVATMRPRIARAVQRHRRIDQFTDTHTLFARSKARLFEQHGRYSGILVDVFYDHLLTHAWATYHDEALPRFIGRVYDMLSGSMSLMPPPMRRPIARMIEQDWLSAYGSDDGLRRVLTMMSWRFTQRFGRQVMLEPAVDDLVLHRPALAADFAAFFPALIEAMRSEPVEAVLRPGAVPEAGMRTGVLP